jgi:hypothetical protein
LWQLKKGTRAAVNQSELESYERLKDSLIPLFENPESLPTAKQKISQVLDFWRVKGKVRKGFLIVFFDFTLLTFRLPFRVLEQRNSVQSFPVAQAATVPSISRQRYHLLSRCHWKSVIQAPLWTMGRLLWPLFLLMTI